MAAEQISVGDLNALGRWLACKPHTERELDEQRAIAVEISQSPDRRVATLGVRMLANSSDGNIRGAIARLVRFGQEEA